MFNPLKKERKYVCCQDFQGGIHFDYSGLFYCATYFHSAQNSQPIAPIKGDIEKNYKQLIKQKEIDKKFFLNGQIIDRCKGCFQLEEKTWPPNQKINRIAISANSRCNSNCIYCTTHKHKEYFNKLLDIKIYDFIKKLIQKKQIDNNCIIQFGGGEPTIHFEFEKVMELLLSKPSYKFKIHSSGITYSESIAEAIKETRCWLITSIDAGNSELYKRIKNVDEFDSVINNISKYCEAQKYSNEPTQVALKYIIIPNINDTEEEILEFLNLANSIGCNAVRADIENNWFKRNRYNVDLIYKYLYLLKFFDIKAKEKGLWQFFNDVPLWLITNYNKQYSDIIIK